MIPLKIIWQPDPTIFTIGDVEVRWYGLLFALGFFLAYFVMYYIFRKEKKPLGLLDRLTLYIFLATVIGARLGHCFFYEWDYYKDHLLEILMIWEGGLASHGAAVCIVIALVIYLKRYRMDVWWLFDRVAMAIPVTAAFVRLGNLMNSEIWGYPTQMPWGFVFAADESAGNAARHPTQLYEALAYLAVSAILLYVYARKKGRIGRGFFVSFFLIGLFTARFVIEFFKEVQVEFEKNLFMDMGQWLSIPFIMLGLAFLWNAYRMKRKADARPSTPPPTAKK